MRVLVTGGRDFADWACVERVLDLALSNHPAPTLVHGAATGADTIADNWAIRCNGSMEEQWCKVERFRADWDKHGKAAGAIRNSEMLATKPDIVIAFPGGRGTADMVRKAKAAGVLVLEVTPAKKKPEPSP